jgi:hypothetical protein
MLEQLVKNLKDAQKAVEDFKDGYQYVLIQFDRIYQKFYSHDVYNNAHTLMEAHNNIYGDERYYHNIYTNNPNLLLEGYTRVFYQFELGKPVVPALTLEQYRLEESTAIKHVVCQCGKYSLATMCIDCANKQKYEMPEDENPYDRSRVLGNEDLWDDDIWK